MKKSRLIAAGLIAGAMLVSVVAADVEARGRGGAGGSQGQNLRLRDGSHTSTPGTLQGNPAGQRGPGSGTGIRPMDGTGSGYGDGTQPRPQDGTGFGRGAGGR
ncbi:MAG: hypothetical protein ACYC69_02035 [Thermodesulfovibrionales bacterium]